MGAAVASVSEDHVLVYNHNFTKSFKIKNYQISRYSDKFDGRSQYVGFILYGYNDLQNWSLNGIKCESGFIHIKKFENIFGVDAYSYHERTYKHLFGRNIDPNKVVGAGFAYCYRERNKPESGLEWKFNSKTFNAPSKAEQWQDEKVNDDWHDECKSMSKLEINWTKKAIKNWINGNNTLNVKDEVKGSREYGPRWSWRKNGKWINYEEETQKGIEENYQDYCKYSHIQHEGFVKLRWGIFTTKPSLKQYEYKLYFDGSIKLPSHHEHSLNYREWKYDTNLQNKYFNQKNETLGLSRIVRRRELH